MNTRHIPSKATRPDRSRSQHRACQRIALSCSIFVLLPFVGCGGKSTASAPTVSSTPTDYSQAQNWETIPNASQGVDLLFFYPTTYGATSETSGSSFPPKPPRNLVSQTKLTFWPVICLTYSHPKPAYPC